ncbi:MAG: DUF3592 domain-containing protein [Anaerolineales bacterium]|nr:DUF3592 domain-containing protein [Anaerolineales bacterium]
MTKKERAQDENGAEPKESPVFAIVLVAVFVGVAILMLAIAGVSASITMRTLNGERQTTGRIVELAMRRDFSGNDYFYPSVEFALPDGVTQTVQLTQGYWPAPFMRGETVGIIYEAAQPRNARIASAADGFERWLVTIITGVIGIAFLGATVIVWWVVKA